LFSNETRQIARIREFCAKSARNETEVQQYAIKKRHNLLVDQKTTKFVEALWRLIFYAYFIYLGYRAMFVPEMVPWLLDTKQNWIGWPLQPVTDAVHYYYQIELAAYLHQLMWTEVTRSDALEMIVHHCATIILVSSSYLTSFTRVGSSILLVHDISDIFLESAKVMNYTSKAKGHKWASPICDTLFILFAISFFVTRLVLFPRYLVYSMTFEASEYMGNWPGHIVFYGLLGVLQCLHIFWFYLILRMVPKLLSTGIQKDERSDDEDDADFIVGDDGKKALGKTTSGKNE
jgi:ceramide synthetase